MATNSTTDRFLFGSREGGGLWIIKLLTGGLILILIGIHLAVNHFIADTGLLTWQDVVNYYRNPLIPVMEITFLIVVVSHSLIGLRSIILDLKPSRGALRGIDLGLWALGSVAVIYGIWLIFSIVAFGN